MKSCQQDISKSIWARGLKLGQLIGDDDKITWLKFKKKNHHNYSEFWPFENLDLLKFVSKISQKLFELGAWNLGHLIGDDEQITWLNFF